MYQTRIRLFGALEVQHGDAPPQHPPTQKVLSLLGLLLTHPDQPYSRDQLVDLLWPTASLRQGRRLLSDALWRARRLLTPPGAPPTPLLVQTGTTLTLCPHPSVWVDLRAFEQHLAAAGPALAASSAPPPLSPAALTHLRAALALYRGELLATCYDDWVLYERERVRELYLSALQQVLAHEQARGAYPAALQLALRLVQADPLRESAHRAVMRLYALLDRPEEALRAYAHCRSVLAEELGVEPAAETRGLAEEIQILQNQGTGLLRATSQELPLIGRQEVRARAMEAVEQAIGGRGGLLLLLGAAGLGKSRLLREVATGAAWRGAQVSWGYGRADAEALPLGPLREALGATLTPLRARQIATLLPPATLSTLLPLLPELVDVLPEVPLLAPPPGEHQVGNLHAALAELLRALGRLAPQVLVLEDLHWFDTATLDALGALQPLLPRARVLLILSARPDALPQRPALQTALWQLDRHGPLQRLDLHGLSAAESAELVRHALQLRQPAPRFSARLHQATSGNPFFLLETLRALQEQGLLWRDAQGAWHTPWDTPEADYHQLPLPRELREAITSRVRDLAPPERAALAAAAVLGTTFSPTTWTQMIEHATPAELLRRHFLVEAPTGYRFGHETLREVVYATLDTPTRQALHLRAAAALEREHYARVEALAQHLYLAGAWDRAWPYLEQAGDRARAVYAWQTARRNYDQALEALTQADPAQSDRLGRWTLQLKRGAIAALLGEYDTALAAYETVLQLAATDAGAPDAAARFGTRRNAQIQALNGLCYVYGQRNDYSHARAASRQALALAAASPRLIDRAEACYQAGLISFRHDDYIEAERMLKQAQELYEALDHTPGLARCWYLLAWTWLRLEGSTDRVIAALERARNTFHDLDAQYDEHDSAIALANVWLWRGALSEAIRLIEENLPFFYSTAARDKIAESQIVRGEALRRMGRYTEALAAVQESYSIRLELGRTAAAQYDQIVMGNLFSNLKRYDDAWRSLQAALKTEDRLNKARALLGLAELSLHRNELKRAFQYVTEALPLVRWLRARAQLGVALRVLGQVRAADQHAELPPPSNEAPDADACFTTSIQLLEAACYEGDLGIAYAQYGAYLLNQQRIREAQAALLDAQRLLQRCGMAPWIEPIQRALQQIAQRPPALEPGQIRVRLARQGTPRGRPLRPEEFVEVVWTVESDEDTRVRARGGRIAERRARLRRLCAEAAAQGAEPTVADLARALGVTTRTVDRDLAALREAGEVLITRGAVGYSAWRDG